MRENFLLFEEMRMHVKKRIVLKYKVKIIIIIYIYILFKSNGVYNNSVKYKKRVFMLKWTANFTKNDANALRSNDMKNWMGHHSCCSKQKVNLIDYVHFDLWTWLLELCKTC